MDSFPELLTFLKDNVDETSFFGKYFSGIHISFLKREEGVYDFIFKNNIDDDCCSCQGYFIIDENGVITKYEGFYPGDDDDFDAEESFVAPQISDIIKRFF